MELEFMKWLGYVLTAVLGWFVRVLWTAQEQMRKDFSALEKELPSNYVRQTDFREVIRDVKEGFKEAVHPVLAKLDRMEERMTDQAKENDRLFQRK